MYIWGNYNTTTDRVHSSTALNDTTNTYPSSVLGDAITVLSSAWVLNSSVDSTASSATTINTALLGGIVITTSASYSGGVENFRASWKTGVVQLTYNGVVPWYCRSIAKSPCVGMAASTYYSSNT